MGTQAPIVKHSTDIEPPTCDPGWTELWTGFSYLMVGIFFRFEFVFVHLLLRMIKMMTINWTGFKF